MRANPSFHAHIELLQLFLKHREHIVERIEPLLNAQRKPIPYLQDRSLLARHFEDCFFATSGQTHLRGQLETAYSAAGFKPRQVQHVYNDLIHPAEMMIRAFHCWQQTRWPGSNGRVHFAHTLFNLYLFRNLEFLSLRIWDEDPSSAGKRLAEIQSALNELWSTSPPDQPMIVRDARWLIPLAQSLITDELAPYLHVAQQVTETLPPADALEIQKAQVRMLGGHLTSQIRYYCAKDSLSINDQSVVVRTRTSNALDFALLIQGLVALLKAYDRAVQGGDERTRLDMAGAILQGISPDPELFLNRVDMLSAYSMIECVFIDDVGYSPLGQRHIHLLKEYGELIARLTPPLRDDAPHFRPVDGGYSPYGVIFGLPSNLIEHMALKTLEHDAESRFSLEDIFADTGDDARLAWVNGWRKLPHIDPEVQRLYDYPHQFAEDIYNRIERELTRRAAHATGRLHIVDGDQSETDSLSRYFVSSDPQPVAAHKAEPYDLAQLLRDRQEGHFLVSYETPGGWMALKKNLLAEVLVEGRDASVPGLPPHAAEVLRLMCLLLTHPETPAPPDKSQPAPPL
jgi:hypothetical protein